MPGAQRVIRPRRSSGRSPCQLGGIQNTDVADWWYSGSRDNRLGANKPHGFKTNSNGRFTLRTDLGSDETALLAIDASRERGALVVVEPDVANTETSITLGPLVTARGKFACPELDAAVGSTNV